MEGIQKYSSHNKIITSAREIGVVSVMDEGILKTKAEGDVEKTQLLEAICIANHHLGSSEGRNQILNAIRKAISNKASQ